MKDSKGLPIGIQITSLPFEDEKAWQQQAAIYNHNEVALSDPIAPTDSYI